MEYKESKESKEYKEYKQYKNDVIIRENIVNLNCIEDIKNTLYINLSKREDRKKHVINQLTCVGIQPINRFNAVEISNGAIGCAMSHLRCLKFALDHNWSHVLICEDDITFLQPQLFIEQLNKLLSVNTAWDVILLGGNNVPPYQVIDDTCIKVTHCQTTTGYIVKRHYYKKLITNIETGINFLLRNSNMKSQYAIDKYWIHLQRADTWYLLTPLTVTQREDYSDIEQKNTNYTKMMLDIDKPYLFARK